jgi:Sec-independent protein secretion pathway component TatC
MFSIGVFEILLTALLGAGALGLHFCGIAASRWLTAAMGCFALASLLTPADIASTLLFGIAFFVCFGFGARQGTRQASPSL